MLENKQVVSDLGSTETVRCSDEVFDHVRWYHVRTGKTIRSGGRFELKGLSLKITYVQLIDMNVEEYSAVSTSRFMLMVSLPYAPFTRDFGIISSSPNHNAILLLLMFSCFVIDFMC